MRQYRQGDCLLIEKPLPSAAIEQPSKVVIGGADHSHRVEEGAIVFQNGEDTYVKVVSPTKLVHEEHGSIVLGESGDFLSVRQRVYHPGRAPRPVND